jgi:hypothetical protein
MTKFQKGDRLVNMKSGIGITIVDLKRNPDDEFYSKVISVYMKRDHDDTLLDCPIPILEQYIKENTLRHIKKEHLPDELFNL